MLFPPLLPLPAHARCASMYAHSFIAYSEEIVRNFTSHHSTTTKPSQLVHFLSSSTVFYFTTNSERVCIIENLNSELFRGDPRLEKVLVNDAAHVVVGDRGEFVSKLQFAALLLGGGRIGPSELLDQSYGPETAKVVLRYKTDRKIINSSYQKTADNIVGKMTIRSLDKEMQAYEAKQRTTNSIQIRH